MTFYLSKVFWFLFNPFNLIIIFLIFGFFSYKFKKFFLANFFYYISLSFFLIFAILPTGPYLVYFLEKDFHKTNYYPEKLDGILILSGATNPFLTKEYDQINLGEGAERLIESYFLIKKFPNVKIIFSGGAAYLGYPEITDSSAAKKFYKDMGLDISKIYFENKSRNTFENLFLSKNYAQPKKNENWLLISSAFHLRRALNVGDELDWKLIPYPTDFRQSKKFIFKFSFDFFYNLSQSNLALHEWLGIFYYYLSNKTSKI